MDNRVFNVNGKGVELLAKVLDLAMIQEGFKSVKMTGFKKDPERGIILYWHNNQAEEKGVTPFLAPPTSGELARMIVASLSEEWTSRIPMEDWDANCDHDGSNELGWRVYCDDWGKVGDDDYAFLCVKPAYMWHGK